MQTREATAPKLSNHKLSRSQIGALVAAVTAVLVVIFAAQNARPVDVNAFFWTLDQVRLFAVITVSAVVGFVLGLLFPALRSRAPRMGAKPQR